MSQSNFHIINAAAGSGKTYTLVLYCLKKLLAETSLRPYRQMLALTFTNKAVNEMKARILEALKNLSDSSSAEQHLQQTLCEQLGIDRRELALRSEKILQKILLEYGSFDVITLDKFTHRIVRTFAREFELPQNFEVALDTKAVLNQVVRTIIDQIGKDEFLTKLLLELSLSKVSQGNSWDVQSDLDQFAQLLLNENDRIPLEELKKKDRNAHEHDRTELKTRLQQTKEKIKSLRQTFSDLLNKKNLNPEDFTRQILHKHLEYIDQEAFENAYKNQLEAMLAGKIPIYKKATEESKKMQIEASLPEFYDLFVKIKEAVEFHLLLEKTLKNWTPRLILQQIEEGLEQLQTEKEIRLLGEFNYKISELVQGEDAPYIFARLGERYQNYYIDEFQDTSTLQWANLKPLIQNALESESLSGERGSLVLVGDPKQAIYRWRGGNISQFTDLLKNQSKPFQLTPSVTQLDVNYRSDQAIVSFNNSFFSHLTNALSLPELNAIYEKGSQQQIKNPGGYVQIRAIPKGGNKEEKIPFYVAETLSAVRKATALNYQEKDIAILVREKKQAEILGEELIAEGFQVLSSESLVVGKSEHVKAIIAVLKLIVNPNSSELHKCIFDQFWNFKNQSEEDYYTALNSLIHLSSIDFFDRLKKWYNLSFEIRIATKLPLIQLTDTLVESFPFLNSNDPYLLAFLEEVFVFSKQKGASLVSFLAHWEVQSQKLRITIPENINAVRVMTIHKAKGLEFPVVILPFMDTSFYSFMNEKVWYSFENSPIESAKWGWLTFSSKLKLCGKQAEAIYNEQLQEKQIDAINVLYVALTRAKHQLYIITQATNEEERLKTYADLFGSFMRSKGSDVDENNSFEIGNSEPKAESVEIQKKNESIKLKIGLSSLWKNHFVLPKEKSEALVTAQKKGLMLHEILSKIKYNETVDGVLEEEFSSRKLDKESQIDLKKRVLKIIQHPELKRYFDGKDKVFCEREILLPNGATLRPDRLNISQTGHVTILDYKTGAPKREDYIQIKGYVDALKELGFDQVESKLIYTANQVEVLAGNDSLLKPT